MSNVGVVQTSWVGKFFCSASRWFKLPFYATDTTASNAIETQNIGLVTDKKPNGNNKQNKKKINVNGLRWRRLTKIPNEQISLCRLFLRNL